MAEKKVTVLVRRSPLNSLKNAEALRQAVGLTLADNRVTVMLVDAAAWLAVPLSPQVIGGGEIKKPLDTLAALRVPVLVEEESLQSWGIDPGQLRLGVQVVSREEVVSQLTAADVVICF